MLFFAFKRNLLQESFDLCVIVLSEVGLIALHLNIQLLDPHFLWLLGLRLVLVRVVDLNAVGFLNVLSLLDLVVHFFQLLLELFFLFVFSVLLVFRLIVGLSC